MSRQTRTCPSRQEALTFQPVFCHFAQLKEQTLAEERTPFESNQNPENRRTTRCLILDKTVKFVSRGGQEFIVPVHLQVLQVFPLQEGVIIKAEYNRDVIHFTPDEEHEPKYSYITLTGHPLNDLKPLALRIPPNQMILDSEFSDLVETNLELIRVFTKIPLTVSFSEKSGNNLAFNLLKKKTERYQTGAEYVRSLEKESRHSLLDNISCEYEKYMIPLFQESVSEKPIKVLLSKSPMSEYKIYIYVFYQLKQEVSLYFWDIRLPADQCIKKLKTFSKIIDMTQIYFTRSKEKNEVALANQKPSPDSMESLEEVKFLKSQGLKKDVLLLEADQQTIQVYQGDFLALRFNLIQQFYSQIGTMKTSLISQFLFENKSSLSLILGTGQSVRLSMKLFLEDFLVQNLINVCKEVLPEEMFLSFYQDLLNYMLFNTHSQADAASQLDKFRLFLKTLIQGQISVQKQILPQQQTPSQTPKQLQTKVLKQSDPKKRLTTTQTSQPKHSFKTSYTGSTAKRSSGSQEAPQLLTPSSQAILSQNPFADMLESDFHKGAPFGSLLDGFIDDLNLDQSPEKASKPSHKMVTRSQKQNQVPNQTQTVVTTIQEMKWKVNSQEFRGFAKDLVFSFHLLHEDLKINIHHAKQRERLAELIVKTCLCLEDPQLLGYIEYYLMEFSKLYELAKDQVSEFKLHEFREQIIPVPQLYVFIQSRLNGSSRLQMPIYFENTRKLVRVYEALLGNFSEIPIQGRKADFTSAHDSLKGIEINQSPQEATFSFIYGNSFEKILGVVLEEKLTKEELQKVPQSLTLPIFELIRFVRQFTQEIQGETVWPEEAFRLIGREDILLNTENKKIDLPNSGIEKLQRGSTFQNQTAMAQEFMDNQKKPMLKKGLSMLEEPFSKAPEKQTEEFKETIKNQLDILENKQSFSHTAEFIKTKFQEDTRIQEAKNLLSSHKEMKVKLDQIPNFSSLSEDEALKKKHEILFRLFQRQISKCVGRGALQVGTLKTTPTETLSVPKINQTGFLIYGNEEQVLAVEFPKDEAGQTKEKDAFLQWPEFHNGVAATLRIASSMKKDSVHSRNWIMYHKPEEPKYEHGGYLLAMGLLGYLDTLHPPDIYQLLKQTHEATSIGVLLGRGASKIGSMDDLDTRTFCIHIPYLLPPSLAIEISLTIQSAAVVGAGLLYKGTSNRLMTEMLLAQIGRKPLNDKGIEREGYALASGLALGLVNLRMGKRMEGLTDLKLNERLIRFVEGGKQIDLPQSMLATNFNHENTKCSAIKEGNMVNTHITAPGALLALILIHLKSENQQIVQQLELPQTFYSLEFVKPSLILLKVLARNLIMWSQIEATEQWIKAQVPELIKTIYEGKIKDITKQYSARISPDEIDYSTVALCYINTIAGAVFALGFKFLGSANQKAFALVKQWTQIFMKMKQKDFVPDEHNDITKNQVDRNSLDTCLSVCAFAASIIMAGTCDNECMQMLRALRKRFEQDMNYGFNQAINMSIGFLYLGSGAYTFSSSDMAIASLIAALYPVFPKSPSDNRYHLQALRHFYILAIETRLIQARDVDSGSFENVPVVATVVKEGKEQEERLQTPAILNGSIKRLKVEDERFYGIQVQFEESKEHQSMANLHRIIYVKKRQGNKFNSNEAKQEKALNQVLCVGSSYDTKELESVLYSGKLESQTPEKFFALQDELEEMQQKLGDSLFKELKLRQEKLGAAVESSMKQDKKEILPLLLKMITDKSLGTLQDLKIIQTYEQGLLKSSYEGFQQHAAILPSQTLHATLQSCESEEGEKKKESALDVLNGGKMVPKKLSKLWKLQGLPSLSQRQLIGILRQEVKEPQLFRTLVQEALELDSSQKSVIQQFI